jgi:hypothetical protein
MDADLPASERRAACSVIDAAIMLLVVKPLVSGKLEIASAPMIAHHIVIGIVRNNPPSSVHLRLPVIASTLPALISSNPL